MPGRRPDEIPIHRCLIHRNVDVFSAGDLYFRTYGRIGEDRATLDYACRREEECSYLILVTKVRSELSPGSVPFWAEIWAARVTTICETNQPAAKCEAGWNIAS
jgi:hypothetical protein